MKRSSIFYIVVILFWFIARGNVCGNHISNGDCSNYKTDTLFLSFNITNQAPVFHILDSIQLYSKISDTVHPQSGANFIFPNNIMTANIQGYKVVPSGASFELNYANIEFNRIINFGSFQSAGNSNYITYERVDPYNTVGVSLVPGYTGLYLFVVNISNGYQETYSQFYKGNDHCTTYDGFTSITPANQNQQYWDSLGITSLRLASFNSYAVNKPDKNYFFVNVVP